MNKEPYFGEYNEATKTFTVYMRHCLFDDYEVHPYNLFSVVYCTEHTIPNIKWCEWMVKTLNEKSIVQSDQNSV